MSPVTELVMTTDPALLRTMVGRAVRQTFQTPLMLMSICASRHTSSLVRKSLSVQMPALQSRMAIVPYILRVKSTRSLQDWASLTSQRKTTVSLPAACSFSSNCKTSLPRAASTTHAPSSVKTRAIPAPMPLEAPVIMAIFPSSLPMLPSSL